MGRHSMQSLAWHCFPERDPRGPQRDHPAVPAGPECVEVLGSVNYKLSLGQKDPLKKTMATHSSILA